MERLPVVYKGKTLMPMKASRIRRLVRDKKAQIKFDRKLGIHYVQLFVDPSGTEIQEVVLGIDPGAIFDGFSVVSKKYHHVNFELIQRAKKGKTSIKFFKERQAGARRCRRARLRHRSIRFDNRTKKKLAPTIRANVEFRQWLIQKLINYYPILKVIIEDVKFNHYESNKGRSFSHVELGKTALYNFVRNLRLELELCAGYETKKLRVNFFGTDLKNRDKDSRDFTTHCIDSFVLACLKTEELEITNDLEVNKKVIFIEKIVKVRRRLTLLRKKYRTKNNQIGPHYYKQLKGGIKQIYQNFSSHRANFRVKPEGEHSNHPKKWEYGNNGFAERFKCHEALHGGTRINGKTFFRNNEWQNRMMNY